MAKLISVLFSALVAIYACNYAAVVWRKQRNLSGALAVILLALATVGLPVYMLYFRH